MNNELNNNEYNNETYGILEHTKDVLDSLVENAQHITYNNAQINGLCKSSFIVTDLNNNECKISCELL